ncbi:non-homologous end joining protein Ku [Paraburkholderia sp. GAS448]
MARAIWQGGISFGLVYVPVADQHVSGLRLPLASQHVALRIRRFFVKTARQARSTAF